jgi:6-pyruvoyltetrahydropterin/6-carboxytetrahydropterin synthase
MQPEYSVTVIRDFIAQHYLIGGDWGAENDPHSHHYRLELTLFGPSLDQHNYMVDIVAIEAALDRFVTRYADKLLNDTPAFADTNPSIELFCRVAWDEIVPSIAAPTVKRATITMWEHDTARASYTATV